MGKSWRVLRWTVDDGSTDEELEILDDYANKREAQYDFERLQGFHRTSRLELQSADWRTKDTAKGENAGLTAPYATPGSHVPDVVAIDDDETLDLNERLRPGTGVTGEI